MLTTSFDLIDYTQAGVSSVLIGALEGVGAVVGSIANLNAQIEIEQSVVSRVGRRLNESVVKVLVAANPEGVAKQVQEADGTVRSVLELYCQPQLAGQHKEFQPGIFSVLATHLPMSHVVRITQRPQVFPGFAKLTIAYDVHELEVFVEEHISAGNTLGILSSIPLGGAAQYGIRSTHCIEMLTNILEVRRVENADTRFLCSLHFSFVAASYPYSHVFNP